MENAITPEVLKILADGFNYAFRGAIGAWIDEQGMLNIEHDGMVASFFPGCTLPGIGRFCAARRRGPCCCQETIERMRRGIIGKQAADHARLA